MVHSNTLKRAMSSDELWAGPSLKLKSSTTYLLKMWNVHVIFSMCTINGLMLTHPIGKVYIYASASPYGVSISIQGK